MLETTLVKVFDLNPLTYPKISKASWFSKIITSVVNASTFVLVVYAIVMIRVTDIRGFISVLVCITYGITGTVNFLYIFHEDLKTVNLYNLQDSDEEWGQVKTTGSKFFYFVFSSIFMFCVSVARNTSSWTIISSLLVLGEVVAMYQLASLKFMAYKRLKWIFDNVQKQENILSFLPAVRKLSDFNGRINKVHSLKLAVALASSFTPYVLSLNAVWEVYGLHKYTGTWEERDPVLFAFSTCQMVLFMIFIGYSVNKYAEMVSYFY